MYSLLTTELTFVTSTIIIRGENARNLHVDCIVACKMRDISSLLKDKLIKFLRLYVELLLIMLVQPTDVECLDLVVKAFSHVVKKINVRKTRESNLIIRTYFDQICEVLQHFLALCPNFQDRQDVHRVRYIFIDCVFQMCFVVKLFLYSTSEISKCLCCSRSRVFRKKLFV